MRYKSLVLCLVFSASALLLAACESEKEFGLCSTLGICPKAECDGDDCPAPVTTSKSGGGGSDDGSTDHSGTDDSSNH